MSMTKVSRRRLKIEVLLAAAATTLAVVTIFWKDWIEVLFRVDPDRGSGLLEWLVVGVLLAVAAFSVLAARWEWRRGHLRGALASNA
jgi:hypothetical protein